MAVPNSLLRFTAGALSRRTRNRWFPVLVLSAIATLRFVESTDIRYTTLFDVAAVGIAAALLSTWYVVCGRPRLPARAGFVGAVWCVVVALLVLFKPVFNGDVGINGW